MLACQIAATMCVALNAMFWYVFRIEEMCEETWEAAVWSALPALVVLAAIWWR